MIIVKPIVKKYMTTQTCGIKEKIGFCKEVLNNAQNRMTLGIIILTVGIGVGVGVGGGLIASAYVKLPE